MRQLTGDEVEQIMLKIEEYVDRYEPTIGKSIYEIDPGNEGAASLVSEIVDIITTQ